MILLMVDEKLEYENNIEGFHIYISSQGDHFAQSYGIIKINDNPLTNWLERNYITFVNNRRIIKTNLVKDELKSIFNVFFTAIKDIEENQNDIISANHLADHFFNSFKPVWGTYNNVYLSFQEIDLWNSLLYEVDQWEQNNNFHIKKGTPFFFNVTNYIDVGNFDFAFYYAHKALEDDKIRGLKQNPNYDYHDSPAFLFASMNERRGQYLYYSTRDLIEKLSSFIDRYNNEFQENLTYQEIRNKFLSNYDEFEDEILFFTYLFITRYYQAFNIETFDLYDNEFAKMRNLNYILSFCLLLDHIMEKKIPPTNHIETYIRYKSKFLIEGLSNGNFDRTDESHENSVKRSLNFFTGHQYFRNPQLINQSIGTMLARNINLYSITSTYTISKNKKIINTMLVYLLRNHGAHDLKLEYLDTITFKQILEALLFQLFVVVQELL